MKVIAANVTLGVKRVQIQISINALVVLIKAKLLELWKLMAVLAKLDITKGA